MCGRFTICITKAELDMILNHDYQIGVTNFDIGLPRYNVAPGQMVVAVLGDGEKHRAGLLKWGYIPVFSQQTSANFSLINAKAETLAEKPGFRHALIKKRCVILANGFYEWKKTPEGKKPHRFTILDRPLFPFAGIWSTTQNDRGDKVHTCAIVTTSANELVQPIHDRMPVILTKTAENFWLDPHTIDPVLLSSLLKPYDPKKMSVYPVSSKVNSAAIDEPSLIEAI